MEKNRMKSETGETSGLEEKGRGVQADWPMWAAWCLGMAVVLWRYAQGIWTWMDETALSLNLVNRSWLGLLDGLRHCQSCPIGYLWGAKACVQLLPGLHGLRLFSVVGYGLGTWLFGRLLTATVKSRWARAGGMGLAVLSPGAVAYGLTVKQYGWEWAMAVGMVWVFLEPRLSERWRLLWLAVFGGVGAFFSTSMAFMMAGIGLGMWARHGWSLRWRNIRGIVVLGAVWVCAMGVESLLLWDEGVHDAMVEWWKNDSSELGILWCEHARLAGVSVGVLARQTLEGFAVHAGGRFKCLLGVLMLLGVAGYWQKRGSRGVGLGWVVLGALGTHLFFGVAGIYPVAARLCWYSSWMWFLLAAFGLDLVGRAPVNAWGGLARTVACLAVFLVVAGDVVLYDSDCMYRKSRGKETIAYLKPRFRPDGSDAIALPRMTRNQVELMTQLGEVPEEWRSARWPRWDEENMFQGALDADSWVCCTPEGAKVSRLWVQDFAAVETGESRWERWGRWLMGGWGKLPAETEFVPIKGANWCLEKPFLDHLKAVHGFEKSGEGEIVERHWGIHFRERVTEWMRNSDDGTQ